MVCKVYSSSSSSFWLVLPATVATVLYVLLKLGRGGRRRRVLYKKTAICSCGTGMYTCDKTDGWCRLPSLYNDYAVIIRRSLYAHFEAKFGLWALFLILDGQKSSGSSLTLVSVAST